MMTLMIDVYGVVLLRVSSSDEVIDDYDATPWILLNILL